MITSITCCKNYLLKIMYFSCVQESLFLLSKYSSICDVLMMVVVVVVGVVAAVAVVEAAVVAAAVMVVLFKITYKHY